MPRFGLATLNHSTLHGLPTQWEVHLDATAEAGFDAIAPDVFWLRKLEEEGVTLASLRAALEARGLVCMEIAGIAIGEAAATAAELEEHVRWSDALGAEFVNARVVEPVDAPLVERARGVAEALAAVGTRLALEFSRGTKLNSVSDARVFSEAIGVPGVGVTLDTWHFFLRPEGIEWDALDPLPADHFANVQLSDGVPYGEGEFGPATMDRRLMPGEGEFDLAQAASRVEARGADLPVVVEVLNAEWRERPLRAFAQRAAESAREAWT
ncbi:unnamed protein product [Discosporangium mesarthrocarpum]